MTSTPLEQVKKAIWPAACPVGNEVATQQASAAIEALRPGAAIRIEHLLYDIGDELEKMLNLKPGTIPLGTGTNIRRFVDAVLGTQSETEQ